MPINLMIETDVVCVSCGYNLRGLHINQRCPECGEAVEASTREDTFATADRKWLRRIRCGLLLMIVAPLPAVVAPFLVHTPLLALILSNPAAFRLQFMQFLPMEYNRTRSIWVMSWSLALISAATTAIAVLLISSRWPWSARDPVRRRFALRAASVAGLIGAAIIGGEPISWIVGWRWWPYSGTHIRNIRSVCFSLLDLFLAIVLMGYLVMLSKRTTCHRLVKRFRVLKWLVIANASLVTGYTIWVNWFGRGRIVDVLGLMMLFPTPIWSAAIVFALACLLRQTKSHAGGASIPT